VPPKDLVSLHKTGAAFISGIFKPNLLSSASAAVLSLLCRSMIDGEVWRYGVISVRSLGKLHRTADAHEASSGRGVNQQLGASLLFQGWRLLIRNQ
jgi:hypothetical protein